MWEAVRNLAALASTPGPSEVSSDPGNGGGGFKESPLFKQKLGIPLAVLLMVLYVTLGHGLNILKDAYKADLGRSRNFLCTFHESGLAILLGLVVGLMVNYGTGRQFDPDPRLFHYLVLPPLMFHQGYALRNKNFLEYFRYIFSFGFLGTAIQFMTITALAFYASNSQYLNMLRDDGVAIGLSIRECMLMAAVFSAADEVATMSLLNQAEFPKLSAVLFGGGVVNDIMSILCFHTVQSHGEDATSIGSNTNKMDLLWLVVQAMYILISAAAVGMGSGLFISRLFKCIYTLKMSPVRQTGILMLAGYLSFSLGEGLELSGTLAVFFCGLTLGRYAWHSLGEEAQVASEVTSDAISMVAKAYCFVAIGLTAQGFDSSQWCWGFIAVMVLVLVIARGFSVYGVCFVGSICLPDSFSMPASEQNVFFFGGLVRGAIAWGQVVQVRDAHRAVMVTTSSGVVLFTTVFFGAVMPFLTRRLERERSVHAPNRSLFQNHLRTGIGGTYGATGENSFGPHGHAFVNSVGVFRTGSSVVDPSPTRGIVHRFWNDFNNRFMRDIFGGNPHENITTAPDDLPPDTPASALGTGQYHLNSPLHPGGAAGGDIVSPPPRRAVLPQPEQHASPFADTAESPGTSGLFGMSCSTNSTVEGDFGQESKRWHEVFAEASGSSSEGLVGGGVGAITPESGPSGGWPI